MFQSKMILLFLCAVFIASSGGAQLSDADNCDPSQLHVCVKQIPKTPIGLPRNKSELDAHCLAYNTGMTCMDKWIRKCLPTDGQRFIQQQIGGARALMHFLCTNDTAVRREYLRETACWSRVSPNWSQCVNELQTAVREISDRAQLLTYVNKNTELCCVRDEYLSCVAHAGRLCSTNGGTLLNRMAWVLAQDVAACSKQPQAYCHAPPLITTTGSILTLISTLLVYLPDFL